MYRKAADGSLENGVVHSEQQFEAAAKDGWVDSPAKLGIETAPAAEPDKAAIGDPVAEVKAPHKKAAPHADNTDKKKKAKAKK